jgi:hypothetical protein
MEGEQLRMDYRAETTYSMVTGAKQTEIQIVRSATSSAFGVSIDAAGRKRAGRPRRFFI